jgi:Protein of unknown function (DUF559)
VPLAVPRDLSYAPFRGSDAIAAGMLTRRQLQSPRWRRMFRDIYVAAAVRLDHHAWCIAASLMLDGRGAISGRSAAALFNVDVLARGAPVEVTVPRSMRLLPPPRMNIMRSALPVGDTQQWAGMLTTTPLRTAFDIARRPPLFEAVVGVDAMLTARLVTRSQLERFGTARKRWPGMRQLHKVLVVCDGGAESPMESRLRLVLIAGGLPWPVTQHEVFDPNGAFVARLDLAYPEFRLGIEYEGDHHRDRYTYQQDLRRINALNACGWTVLRFGAADVYRNPGRVVATVRAALIR